MSEAKSFASLSSGLLARKGAARPAMRPQGFGGHFSSSMDDLGWNDMGHSQSSPPAPACVPRAVPVGLTPVGADDEFAQVSNPAPPIVQQQRAAIEASFSATPDAGSVLSTKVRKPAATAAEVADVAAVAEVEELDELESEVEEAAPAVADTAETPKQFTAKATGKAKAAFTLRLDSNRHLKLRLACAVTGRSAQQLVTEALDQLLRSKPEVEALAGQLPGTSH